MNIKKVAVVGAGTMGNQIAMQTAISGFETVCYSRSEATLEKAETFSHGWFEKRVEKGKLTQKEAEACQSRLSFTTDLKAAVSGADLVIEAVADVLETKRRIFAEIDSYTPEHCIFASNSSYIVSSLFCDAVIHPENVVNLHFFNPALVMKLVEVVKGPHCSQETINTMMEFVGAIHKVPALVQKEIYGFLVNRIFSAMTKEACYLLDQGVGTVEDIDNAVKFGLGHSMGPLELLDLTGIDLEYDVLMERYKMTGSLSDKPSPSIVERHARGEYGRKTGKGFYEYK